MQTTHVSNALWPRLSYVQAHQVSILLLLSTHYGQGSQNIPVGSSNESLHPAHHRHVGHSRQTISPHLSQYPVHRSFKRSVVSHRKEPAIVSAAQQQRQYGEPRLLAACGGSRRVNTPFCHRLSGCCLEEMPNTFQACFWCQTCKPSGRPTMHMSGRRCATTPAQRNAVGQCVNSVPTKLGTRIFAKHNRTKSSLFRFEGPK